MYGKHQFSKKLVLAAALGLVALAPLRASAANKLIVNGADGTTPAFVVSNTGNIGIGTTSPYYPIHIVAGGPTSVTTLEFRNTGNPDLTTRAPWDAPTVQLIRNNPPTYNGGLPEDGDRLGYFVFGTYVGSTIRYSAGVIANAEGSSGDATSFPGYLSLQTTTYPSAYPSEKVRISSAGNVGIGTGNPGQKLEVNGGVLLNTGTAQPACGSTVRGTLWFIRGGSGVPDSLQVCAKDTTDDNIYHWKALF